MQSNAAGEKYICEQSSWVGRDTTLNDTRSNTEHASQRD